LALRALILVLRAGKQRFTLRAVRSTAMCCFAAQQNSAASQHSNVLLRSTAKCCFAAQCSMVCAAPNCGASRRNLALAFNAALRAALLRFAQRAALRAAHAASQHACKYRNCGKSPQARGFCGRHQVSVNPVRDQNRKTTVVVSLRYASLALLCVGSES